MVHLKPDKKMAERDADTLLNGDLENAINDPECADPYIEEVATNPEDGDEDVATLRLMVGGEYLMAEVPPCDGQPNWDYALAIKRAGIHIHALLQENARLEASVGRDAFADKQNLIIVLRQLRDRLKPINYFMSQACELDSESVTGFAHMIKEIDTLLAEVDKPPKDG